MIMGMNTVIQERVLLRSRTCSTQDINEAIKSFEDISGDKLTYELKQILCNI